MIKLLKVSLVLVSLVLVLAFGASYFLTRNLPAIVTELVETQGGQATGTAVTLEDIQFNFMNGRVALSNLVIANPKGYKTPSAFRLGDLVFKLNLPTLLNRIIQIDEFTISGAGITAEQVGHSMTTNLQRIADYAKVQSGSSSSESAKADKSVDSPSSSEQIRIIVKQFNFTGSSLQLVSEQWGNREIVVPDLILKDIGKEEGGLTPEQLTHRITRLVTQQANNALRDQLEGLVESEAKKKLSNKIKNKFNSWLGK